MNEPGDIVVRLSHVTLRYVTDQRDLKALQGLNLSISEGERVCVLGANGSGKSTLASVICGLLAPDEGEVTLVGQHVYGEDGADFEAYRQARRRIGLVFQNPDDQIVTSVVEEDVAFGPENLGLPPEEISLRVARELQRVALTDYAKSDPLRLSGGQKQRVAIAGALAMKPRMLVLDEPGALLDVRGRRGIMRVMGQLKDEGTTIVHITHFMEEALAADRVIVMDHGRIALEGTPDEVFSHKDELASLGLEMPFEARLEAALQKRRTEGANDNQKEKANALPSDDVVLSCEKVSFTYHDAHAGRALDDISFSVKRGASVAIVGQTGSGKSTLVRLLCALEVPDVGTVTVDGISTATRRGRRSLHGHVGYVMQHPERQLFAETVYEDVSYGPRNMGLTQDEIDRRCRHALEVVGLVDKDAASPFHLSGGQQRLCAIAGVLAMEPTILVLDEPTAGLDPRGREQLEHILDNIHSRGVTIIRVTHSMDIAARAEHILVLSQSKLLMSGTPEEVFSPSNAQTLHDIGLGLPEPTKWAIEHGVAPAPLTMSALVSALCASDGEVS